MSPGDGARVAPLKAIWIGRDAPPVTPAALFWDGTPPDPSAERTRVLVFFGSSPMFEGWIARLDAAARLVPVAGFIDAEAEIWWRPADTPLVLPAGGDDAGGPESHGSVRDTTTPQERITRLRRTTAASFPIAGVPTAAWPEGGDFWNVALVVDAAGRVVYVDDPGAPPGVLETVLRRLTAAPR